MGAEKNLTLGAVAALLALGAVSLYSIYEYAEKTGDNPGFAYSPEYLGFMQQMDRLAFPIAVAFLLILAVCIPKRVVPERLLLPLSAALVLVAVVLYFRDYRFALGVVLLFAFLLQLLVLGLTLAGRELHFMRQGYWKRVGSALVHLGVVAVLLSIVQPAWVLTDPITFFWGATAAITAGMALLFYAGGGGR
ncbi:MAG: hypothetical protein GXO66_06805 [Euryarchaeota archaeon]|nr:hypothetical protein [Euryarchaeota archaeon]